MQYISKINVENATYEVIDSICREQKADKENLAGTGSIAINKLAGSQMGGYSANFNGENTASGTYSFSEGYRTISSGEYSHAGGQETIANSNNLFAIGKFNDPKSNDLFEIGNGDNANNRKNAFRVTADGSGIFNGDLMINSGTSNEIALTSKISNIEASIANSQYILPKASKNTLGGVKVGENLEIDRDGTLSAIVPVPRPYVLRPATETTLGGIKVGEYLSMDEYTGTLNVILPAIPDEYELPIASSSRLGGIKIDESVNFKVNEEGVLEYKTEKLNKNNPNGQGALSLNRSSGSTVGICSTATGRNNIASGAASTATGQGTEARGNYTLTAGVGTQAKEDAQTAIGAYNENKQNNLFEIGRGAGDKARENAFEVDKSGNVYALGDIVNGNEISLNWLSESKEDAFGKNTAFNKNFEGVVENIAMNGAPSIGVLDTIARADHIHPSDVTKASQEDVLAIQESIDEIEEKIIVMEEDIEVLDARNIFYFGYAVDVDMDEKTAEGFVIEGDIDPCTPSTGALYIDREGFYQYIWNEDLELFQILSGGVELPSEVYYGKIQGTSEDSSTARYFTIEGESSYCTPSSYALYIDRKSMRQYMWDAAQSLYTLFFRLEDSLDTTYTTKGLTANQGNRIKKGLELVSQTSQIPEFEKKSISFPKRVLYEGVSFQLIDDYTNLLNPDSITISSPYKEMYYKEGQVLNGSRFFRKCSDGTCQFYSKGPYNGTQKYIEIGSFTAPEYGIYQCGFIDFNRLMPYIVFGGVYKNEIMIDEGTVVKLYYDLSYYSNYVFGLAAFATIFKSTDTEFLSKQYMYRGGMEFPSPLNPSQIQGSELSTYLLSNRNLFKGGLTYSDISADGCVVNSVADNEINISWSGSGYQFIRVVISLEGIVLPVGEYITVYGKTAWNGITSEWGYFSLWDSENDSYPSKVCKVKENSNIKMIYSYQGMNDKSVSVKIYDIQIEKGPRLGADYVPHSSVETQPIDSNIIAKFPEGVMYEGDYIELHSPGVYKTTKGSHIEYINQSTISSLGNGYYYITTTAPIEEIVYCTHFKVDYLSIIDSFTIRVEDSRFTTLEECRLWWKNESLPGRILCRTTPVEDFVQSSFEKPLFNQISLDSDHPFLMPRASGLCGTTSSILSFSYIEQNDEIFGDIEWLAKDSLYNPYFYNSLNVMRKPLTIAKRGSISLGEDSNAAAENSYAIGQGVEVNSSGQVALGKFNENKAINAFELGWGTEENRKNIFEITQDGTLKCRGIDDLQRQIDELKTEMGRLLKVESGASKYLQPTGAIADVAVQTSFKYKHLLNNTNIF